MFISGNSIRNSKCICICIYLCVIIYENIQLHMLIIYICFIYKCDNTHVNVNVI